MLSAFTYHDFWKSYPPWIAKRLFGHLCPHLGRDHGLDDDVVVTAAAGFLVGLRILFKIVRSGRGIGCGGGGAEQWIREVGWLKIKMEYWSFSEADAIENCPIL